jgi:hypothetical protein
VILQFYSEGFFHLHDDFDAIKSHVQTPCGGDRSSFNLAGALEEANAEVHSDEENEAGRDEEGSEEKEPEAQAYSDRLKGTVGGKIAALFKVLSPGAVASQGG